MIVIGLISLTGCGQKKATAYQSYVKNLLDVNYKGDYTNYIKENKDKLTFTDKEIEFMCHVISSHMGPWNTNNYSNIVLPKPESKFQRFVHMCDYLASRKVIDVKFDSDNNIEE